MGGTPRPKVGVLRIDYDYPYQWGDIDDPHTIPGAVFHKVVGLTFAKCKDAGPDCSWVQEKLRYGVRELQRRGCDFITGDCGFLFAYQHHLVNHRSTRVPLQLSSLGLLPTLHSAIGDTKGVLIVTADSVALRKQLSSTGAMRAVDVIVGVEHAAGFGEEVRRGQKVDVVRTRASVARIVVAALRAHSQIACLLLECTELPLYRHHLQRVTGLPTYSVISMVDFYLSGFGQSPQSL